MSRKWFWINYAFLWVDLGVFYWWIQAAYIYMAGSLVSIQVLKGICLLVAVSLISMVGDFEIAPDKINKGLKQFLLKIVTPILPKRGGIILPSILLFVVIYLFHDYRFVRITADSLPSTSRIQFFIGDKNISDTLLKGDYIVARRDYPDWPVISISAEYGFFPIDIPVKGLFNLGAYLQGKRTDVIKISRYQNMPIDYINKKIFVTVDFLNAKGVQEEIRGSINPTSKTWKNFDPPNGIEAFLDEVSKSVSRDSKSEKKEFAIHYFNMDYQYHISGDRTISIKQNGVGPTQETFDNIEKSMICIVNNGDDAAKKCLIDLYNPLGNEEKNDVLRKNIEKLTETKDLTSIKSSAHAVCLGKWLDAITNPDQINCAFWIDDRNKKALFNKIYTFLDIIYGEDNIIVFMQALMRLCSAVPETTGYQERLLNKMSEIFLLTPYDKIRNSFIEEAMRLKNVPNLDSVDLYMKCLEAILGSSNCTERNKVLYASPVPAGKKILASSNFNVRYKIKDLLYNLNQAWGSNPKFKNLFVDYSENRCWPAY